MRVCIVGASGKLGRYMVQHALDRGDEVVGVCREGERSETRCVQGPQGMTSVSLAHTLAHDQEKPCKSAVL